MRRGQEGVSDRAPQIQQSGNIISDEKQTVAIRIISVFERQNATFTAAHTMLQAPPHALRRT